MVENELLIGWRQIAEFTGLSDRSVRSWRYQLIAEEVIFYRRTKMGKRSVCAWKGDVRTWLKKRGVKV